MMGFWVKKAVYVFTLTAFLLSNVMPAFAQTSPLSARPVLLPIAGERVELSEFARPAVLKGVKVYPNDPFRFDFILSPGGDKKTDDELKDESAKLIRYFLASITIPEKDMWVNLSPFEQDRIVPDAFGQTEMGRDLLAQDYLLKQITASLLYPEGEAGKRFWQQVYEKAYATYGTTDIPLETFNKVWIMPDKAVVYENAEAGTSYVVESRLKVMLETDYLALATPGEETANLKTADGVDQTSVIAKEAMRSVVIPILEKEVNDGANFARLRQVYQSLILAAWYKKKIKSGILSQVYADRNKVAGVNITDTDETQRIFERYLDAFKKGVYNYVKEEQDLGSDELIPRKYFSGGVDNTQLTPLLEFTTDNAGVEDNVEDLVVEAKFVEAKDQASVVDGAMTAIQKLTKALDALDDRTRSKCLEVLGQVMGLKTMKGSGLISDADRESVLTNLQRRSVDDFNFDILAETVAAADRAFMMRYLAIPNSLSDLIQEIVQAEKFEAGATALEVASPQKRGSLKGLEKIDPDTVQYVLDRVRINGRLAHLGGAGLSVKDISDLKMSPKYKTEVGGRKIYYSRPFEIENGRTAVLAFVEENGEYVARTYYFSNSSTLLRYLLRVTFKPNGSIEWYDKGRGEDSLAAPWESRMAVAELLQRETPAILSRQDRLLLFVGTTRSVMPDVNFDPNEMTYIQETEKTPDEAVFNDNPSRSKKLLSPEDLKLEGNKRPDYNDPKGTWSQITSLYGKVTYFVFPSMDGEYLYTFMKDSQGRVCMPVIQKKGDVNQLGLYSSWIRGGSFTTPLKEYTSQAFGYGNYNDVVQGYEDMWENYLSKAPFIQDFLASVKDQNDNSDEADTQPGDEADTQPGDPSQAEKFRKGGIDFNSGKMNLDVQNKGGEINFQIDAALLERLEAATGFTPVILNIQPLPAVRMFLGINTSASPNA